VGVFVDLQYQSHWGNIKMKNLAGAEEADIQIQEELLLAGIELVHGVRGNTEVPYSITGKLGDFTFRRAWYYWMAGADEGNGLPVDVATAMHERAYPIVGERQPATYGQVIRVAGHCGCPPPSEWADHFDDLGRKVVLDPEGEQEASLRRYIEQGYIELKVLDKLRFAPSLEGVAARSVVTSYHIDSQLGLNEFARVLKEL
jgi:hypothetical protein